MSAQPDLQQQVDGLREELAELRRQMAAQHEAWTTWREADARHDRPAAQAPERRSRRPRSRHTGTRHFEVLPGGAA